MQVSKAQYDRVHGYIESGKKEGATVILGGEKRTGKGFFIDPTSLPLLSITLIDTDMLHGQFSLTSDQI
jgi:hypothetical protein